MSTGFTATTPEELLHEYNHRMNTVRDDLSAKIATARKKGKFDKVKDLTEQMQNMRQQLTGAYNDHLATITGGESSSVYNRTKCTADLDLAVYDGDRDYIIEFNRDPDVQEVLNEIKVNNPVFQTRKHLLKTSLRLTPVLAPSLYAIGKKCKEVLGLKANIEFYVYQSDQFNAACYPPDEDRLYIIVTSNLLEKFDDDELAFVVGHEIGHALFDHFRYPAGHIMETGANVLSPLHAMKLFAWQRNAEISADRIGLLCCQNFEAAGRTFFKLSSGVTTDTLDFQLQEYIKQFVDLEDILSSGDVDPEDWYTSHPFSPLRIKALELFSQSQTYHALLGQSGGNLSEEDMELKIQQILSLMEPTYLTEESETAAIIQRFMFLGGYLITIADGSIYDSEIQALSTLLPPDLFTECMEAVHDTDFEDIRDELIGLAGQLNTMLSVVQKLNILRDLSVISYADGEIDQSEVDVLYNICNILNIRPEFIDQVLNSAEQME